MCFSQLALKALCSCYTSNFEQRMKANAFTKKKKISPYHFCYATRVSLVASSLAWHWAEHVSRTTGADCPSINSRFCVQRRLSGLTCYEVVFLAVSGPLCENTIWWPLFKQGYVREQRASPSRAYDGWFFGDLCWPRHPWPAAYAVVVDSIL